MFSFFTWLRSRVRDSVLAGVNDALAELHEPAADIDQAAALLRQRLTALPAPVVNGTHHQPSKPEAAAVGDGEDPTAKRSRRGRVDGDG
jgi:hypothetical protein